MYYKARTNYFPVLLCTKKLAESTSQYYCVLQVHKHVPVLLCTTKLAQTTSQYYCVLQSLQKHVPSTTVHYKAGTNYFQALLCTTKLAQTRSQYYRVLQSLHKVLPSVLQRLQKHVPSTTVYYKARTNYFEVLLCTTKLAHYTLHSTLHTLHFTLYT